MRTNQLASKVKMCLLRIEHFKSIGADGDDDAGRRFMLLSTSAFYIYVKCSKKFICLPSPVRVLQLMRYTGCPLRGSARRAPGNVH